MAVKAEAGIRTNVGIQNSELGITDPITEPAQFLPATDSMTRAERLHLEGVFQTLPFMVTETGIPTVTNDILTFVQSLGNKKVQLFLKDLPSDEKVDDSELVEAGEHVFRKIQRDPHKNMWVALFTSGDDHQAVIHPLDKIQLTNPPRSSKAIQGTLKGIPLEAIKPRQLGFDTPGIALQEFEPEPIRGSFKGKDIISIKQFDPQSMDVLFRLADEMATVAQGSRGSDLLKGFQVNLSFYEPSTRTHDSFETAGQQLGAAPYGSPSPKDFSSAVKGESLHDSMKTIGAYGDAIILRHPDVGSALEAAKSATTVPVINAGDGIGEHPTQALLDLYTIQKEAGRLHDLNVVMMGDMLNGRTIHSLIEGLAMYRGNRFTLLSPDKLRLPAQQLIDLQERGIPINEIKSPHDMPQISDVWYVTRIQKERFPNPADYEKMKGSYVVNREFMRRYANADTVIMHPMPRNDEIPREVDSDPRAAYFRQSRNGQYIRMALMALVLGKVSTEDVSSGRIDLKLTK